METEITLPEVVAVMTLPHAVLFPQAVLPLHIFEPRYRHMLKDILASHRMFAVAGIDPERPEVEHPYRIATVGIVRACHDAEDGTSNLLLQGLCRVEILQILREKPYRRIRVRALHSTEGAAPETNARLREDLDHLIAAKRRLGASVSKDLQHFLRDLDDPGAFVDIAAFSLCEDDHLRQRLLETLSVHERLVLLHRRLTTEVHELKLRRKLQGPLADDHIADN